MTCTELGTPAPTARFEKRRNIQPNTAPMKPASFSGERMPGAVGRLSSGLVDDTLISADAAISSRQGALEPDAGFRVAFFSIASLSLRTASSAGGTTEAVVRLPPDPGPSARLESPI